MINLVISLDNQTIVFGTPKSLKGAPKNLEGTPKKSLGVPKNPEKPPKKSFGVTKNTGETSIKYI
jgi:hypothetical protein